MIAFIKQLILSMFFVIPSVKAGLLGAGRKDIILVINDNHNHSILTKIRYWGWKL